MASVQKFRYFAFVVYPDSAPEDWWERLRRTHCAFACSPLHEPDEEMAKPHYHVIYRNDNTISLANAKRRIPEGVAANGYVEPVHSPTGSQRYLVHLDDGDKQQFDGDPYELIQVCNGFPLDLTRPYTDAEIREQRMICFQLIRDYDIVEYSVLLDGLMDTHMYDIFDWASKHTILVNAYLTSRRHRGIDDEEGPKCDKMSYVK